MNLQVLPLKILATRAVVMNRMDYSTYLTSITKEELDRLDILAGDFKVQASKLIIEAVYDGKKLPSDDWEYLKSCFNLPKLFTKVIERTKEFSIVEFKSGQRDWTMGNVWWKKRMLVNKGKLYFSSDNGWDRWIHTEDFIEDGKLVNVIKNFKMHKGKMVLSLDFRMSLTTDKEGNIIWNLIWSAPHRGVKITKVVRAVRGKLLLNFLGKRVFVNISNVRVLKAIRSWKSAQTCKRCLYYFILFAFLIFGLLMLLAPQVL